MGCHREKEIERVHDTTSEAPKLTTAEVPAATTSDLYSVAAFSPERDPKADLISTIELAQASGKRIILEIGGDW